MAELTAQDIGNALQIIDECARRGAFQGPELSSVGAVREKLAAYVAANNPQNPEENTEAPEQPVIPNEED